MSKSESIEHQLTGLLKDLPSSTRIRISVSDFSISIEVDYWYEDKTSKLRHQFSPGEDSIVGAASRCIAFLKQEHALREGQRQQWLDEQSVNPDTEELIEKSLEILRKEKRASPSLFQRRLGVGFARANQIIEILERRGILGPGIGAQSREIFRLPS